MSRRWSIVRGIRVSCLPLVLVAVACGGGGGGGGTGGGSGGTGTMPGPLVATFLADAACVASNELQLAPAASVGDTFDLEIRASGLANLFGTGFTVTYNSATAMYLGCDSAGSFLVNGGAPSTPCNGSGISGSQFLAQLEGGVQGAVNVVATRVGNVAGVSPTSGNDLLLTLTFRAVAATSAPNSFALTTPREAQTCASTTSGCTMVPDGNIGWCGGQMTATMN